VIALLGEVSIISETLGDVQLKPDGCYFIDGQYAYADFLDYSDREDLLLHDERFNTVVGLVLDQLSYVSKLGETVHWHSFTLTVERMNGIRVEQVRVQKST